METNHRSVLAPTPPMGWNSWNGFGPGIDEAIVRRVAETLVDNGMRDLGYRYVVIDDGWQAGERDGAGRLVADPQKFPSGMKAIGDFLHERGLLFGIYSGPGPKTCLGRPGSYGHERADVEQFVSWGVDFLKYDECSAIDFGEEKVVELYRLMGRLLRESGRPIVLSISTVDRHRPWLWAAEAGAQMWRTTRDILDYWREGPEDEKHGIDSIGFEQQEGLEKYAGPGRWNDPDMLVVGLHGRGFIAGEGCTDTEYRTHMTLWCMLAAPLMLGADPAALEPADLEILTNPEVIAIDQDPLGRQGRRIRRHGAVEVWCRELADGGWAAGFFNRGPRDATVDFAWKDLGFRGGPFRVRDLWARREIPEASEGWSGSVESHGAVLLRLRPAGADAGDQ